MQRTAARMPLLRAAAHTAAAVAVLLSLVLGCGRKEPQTAGETQPSAVPLAEQVRIRHILVQYAGARAARADIVRSRAEADSLVRALHAQLEEGASFAELARRYSDDGSGADGGEIAPLQPGDAPPEFERVARETPPGQLSPVFESPLGFHVLQRLSTEKIAAQHILIAYTGARGAADSLQRTRLEALALAERLLAELQNPLTSFPVAAATYSDDRMTYTRGGYLGLFVRGNMHPAFEQAAFALEEDQISGIVETPFGFHIIRRVKPLTIRVAHILVRFASGGGLDPSLRTEEQALQRALDALFRARQGEDFATLAQEYSDDKHTAAKGGKLPRIDRGQTVPEFEEVAFSLEPGQVSDVVKTVFGFHILMRLD